MAQATPRLNNPTTQCQGNEKTPAIDRPNEHQGEDVTEQPRKRQPPQMDPEARRVRRRPSTDRPSHRQEHEHQGAEDGRSDEQVQYDGRLRGDSFAVGERVVRHG